MKFEKSGRYLITVFLVFILVTNEFREWNMIKSNEHGSNGGILMADACSYCHRHHYRPFHHGWRHHGWGHHHHRRHHFHHFRPCHRGFCA